MNSCNKIFFVKSYFLANKTRRINDSLKLTWSVTPVPNLQRLFVKGSLQHFGKHIY